jgi:hypothetical protein
MDVKEHVLKALSGYTAESGLERLALVNTVMNLWVREFLSDFSPYFLKKCTVISLCFTVFKNLSDLKLRNSKQL